MKRYHVDRIITPANHQAYLTPFKAVVTSRRSVRAFTDTHISDQVLNDCLDMALLAPNSSNLQPWQFFVIDTPFIKKQVVKFCMNQNAARTANRLIVVVARTDNWFQHAKDNITFYPVQPVPKVVKTYYQRLMPLNFLRGPLNILSPAKWMLAKTLRQTRGAIIEPVYRDAHLIEWAKSNTMLAAQNFMLALRAYGFDSCPMGGFDEPQLKALLHLSDQHHVVMVIAAGERSEDALYAPQYRFDRDRFIKVV